MRCTRLFAVVALVGSLMLGFHAVLTAQAQEGDDKCRLIYVPTPHPVVDKMLDMAKVTDKDFVFDLGCGDGRIVAIAAKKYGAKGVGVDLDPPRLKDCLETLQKKDYGATNIKEEKDKDGITKLVATIPFGGKGVQVEYRRGDALKVSDLEKATVIQLYMLPEFMGKLEKQVNRLQKGCRIVAHDYAFPNMKPDVTIEFQGPDRAHTLYMWTIK